MISRQSKLKYPARPFPVHTPVHALPGDSKMKGATLLSAIAAALSFALFYVIPCTAGAVVQNSSIIFTAGDFSSGVTASKQWGIYGNGSTAPDTPVWSISRFTMNANSFAPSNANSPNPAVWAQVTWRITVPEDFTISSFTWGVDWIDLQTPAASTDDTVAVQYSFDDITWTTFDNGILTYPNTYSDQTFTSTVPEGTSVSALYIRIRHVEGGDASTGDPAFFRLMSNNSAGGLNDASFIQLTVVPIPEPSTTVFATTASTAIIILLVICRRRYSRR
ncbi:hypothetical protein Ga0100231_008595 [Opitutaceae bacterium TAV4]|nr:hypothetical protein Ga0100231_008595 [Opitutaceae bacterium TAV4]RRJ98498.1 hypothetical protein Ga0100230_008880 [Opitutaceae bacterium TAV3]